MTMLKIENLDANVSDKLILKGFSLALGMALATVPSSAKAEAPVEHPLLESKVASGSIVIPDEIASAVVPYLMCLNKAINEGVSKTGNGANAEQMPVIEEEALQHCRGVRETATTKAENLLLAYNDKIETTARAAKIESTLVGIEVMFTGMADKMKIMNAVPAEAEKNHAEN